VIRLSLALAVLDDKGLLLLGAEALSSRKQISKSAEFPSLEEKRIKILQTSYIYEFSNGFWHLDILYMETLIQNLRRFLGSVVLCVLLLHFLSGFSIIKCSLG
jgi:hypothetical protein